MMRPSRMTISRATKTVNSEINLLSQDEAGRGDEDVRNTDGELPVNGGVMVRSTNDNTVANAYALREDGLELQLL